MNLREFAKFYRQMEYISEIAIIYGVMEYFRDTVSSIDEIPKEYTEAEIDSFSICDSEDSNDLLVIHLKEEPEPTIADMINNLLVTGFTEQQIKQVLAKAKGGK